MTGTKIASLFHFILFGVCSTIMAINVAPPHSRVVSTTISTLVTPNSTIVPQRGHLSTMVSATPNSTIASTTPTFSDRILLRLLKRKRKKLKQLKQDIQDLESQLHSESKNETQEAENLPPKKNKSQKSKKTSFQRKMLRQLRRLSVQMNELQIRLSPTSAEMLTHLSGKQRKLLKTLLKQMEDDTEDWRKTDNLLERPKGRRKNNNNSKRKHQRRKERMRHEDRSPSSKNSTSYTEQARITNSNSSKPGNIDAACQSHNFCLPGLCCHKGSTGTAVCKEHHFQADTVCHHSCQCAAGLHCYRANDQSSNARNKTQIAGRKQEQARIGMCKVASISDVLNGGYINGNNVLFES